MDAFIEQQDIDLLTNIARNSMEDPDWNVISYVNGFKSRIGQKVTIYKSFGGKNSDFERVAD